MFRSAPSRCAQLLFVLGLAASSMGCPQLNMGPAPGAVRDPFMNVADDVDEPFTRPRNFQTPQTEPTKSVTENDFSRPQKEVAGAWRQVTD